MPDLLAGTKVYALDRPPGEYTFENTAQTSLSSTTYAEPTNTCRVTFVAPTSGRVKVVVGGGARDDTNDIQVFLAVEIRETDVSGTIVESPTAYRRGTITMPEASDYQYQSRITILEGLTPGQVYFARIMYRVDVAGGTADLRLKDLAVIPVP